MLCPVEDAEGTLQVKASLVSIPVLVFLGPAAQSINRTSVGHPVVVCVLALGDSDITTLSSCNDHLSNYTASYNYLSITTTTSNTDALHSRLLTVVPWHSVCLPTSLGSSTPQSVGSFQHGYCGSPLPQKPRKLNSHLSPGLQLHFLRQGLNPSLAKIYSSTFALPWVLCLSPRVLYSIYLHSYSPAY